MENDTQRRHEEYMQRYLASQPSLRAYVLSILRDFHMTEDVLQEVAFAAWRQYDAYDPSRPFVAWVLSIARNKCLDLRRARKAQPLLPDDVTDRLAEDASRLTEETTERQKALARCVETLTEAVRSMLRLRLEENLKMEEIARRQGKSLDAVRRALSRARAFLVECTGKALAMGGS